MIALEGPGHAAELADEQAAEEGQVRAAGRPLRVLLVHNRYQQPGGEDAVVADELAMLEANGVEVELYERHNEQVARLSKSRLAAGTVWSRETTGDLARIAQRFAPDLIHAHNTFPLISPSLYYGAAAQGIPVVQTLHNFRLFCAQAMFMRDGAVCEDCLGALPWRGVLRGCYRGSVAQSAVLVGMLGVHRALGSYSRRVARYIALNRFCRDKFIEAGLPAERIVVKPNFVDLPAPGAEVERAGALFVGRLSAEKGIAVLAQAARLTPEARIDVIGDGPERQAIEGLVNVRLVGRQAPAPIFERMRAAQFLLLPSVWYENFPRVLVEAFACGLPVVASRLGAMAELVEEGVTGLLFNPGDARDLAEKLAWAQQNPQRMRRMGAAARQVYEGNYTSAANFRQLRAIYQDALHAA
ncbi:MAG TPA: glycosyltransferase [Burkholderiales bacterium]|jgi:glycosyltransferase involved in cell wall biosynthesis